MPASWEALGSLPPVGDAHRMRAAVLIPLYEVEGRIHVILTRRPDDMRKHPGDIVFPGGMIDPDDAGPVEAAMREAEEEIGLAAGNVVEVLGGLDARATPSVMRIVPVVARVERPERLVPEPGEVAAILEPAIDDLLDDDRWQTRWWGPGRRMWFYAFPEGVLWGATALMVRELLDYFR